MHIFIVSSSRVGMQSTQVLTPFQRRKRFLSVHRRRQEQVGCIFSLSRFYLFFPQAQMATAWQDEEERERVVSAWLVQANLCPIELVTLDDSTDTLQPPSSSVNVRPQPSEATNLETIVTSPVVSHLMEAFDQSTPSASHEYAWKWNTGESKQALRPLSGSSNSQVLVQTAPAMSPPLESLVREVMTSCDASLIYDASTSTIFYTTTSAYRPFEETRTSLRPLTTWSNKLYSSYQKGHDWGPTGRPTVKKRSYFKPTLHNSIRYKQAKETLRINLKSLSLNKTGPL